MEKVIKRYLLKFDEIEKLKSEYATSLPDTVNELIEQAEDLLIDAYLEGFASAGYILLDDIDRKANNGLMFASVFKDIDGKDFEDRLSEHYLNGDVDGIGAVLDTEFHRNWVQGALDRAKSAGAKYKKWVTVRDNKVRETHSYIDGITLPITGEFSTFDGDKATAPGMFKFAQNNVNCRCILNFE